MPSRAAGAPWAQTEGVSDRREGARLPVSAAAPRDQSLARRHVLMLHAAAEGGGLNSRLWAPPHAPSTRSVR